MEADGSNAFGLRWFETGRLPKPTDLTGTSPKLVTRILIHFACIPIDDDQYCQEYASADLFFDTDVETNVKASVAHIIAALSAVTLNQDAAYVRLAAHPLQACNEMGPVNLYKVVMFKAGLYLQLGNTWEELVKDVAYKLYAHHGTTSIFAALDADDAALVALETEIRDSARQDLIREVEEALLEITSDNVDTCILFAQLFDSTTGCTSVHAFQQRTCTEVARLFNMTYPTDPSNAADKGIKNFLEICMIAPSWPPFTSMESCLLFMCTRVMMRLEHEFQLEVPWPWAKDCYIANTLCQAYFVVTHSNNLTSAVKDLLRHLNVYFVEEDTPNDLKARAFYYLISMGCKRSDMKTAIATMMRSRPTAVMTAETFADRLQIPEVPPANVNPFVQPRSKLHVAALFQESDVGPSTIQFRDIKGLSVNELNDTNANAWVAAPLLHNRNIGTVSGVVRTTAGGASFECTFAGGLLRLDPTQALLAHSAYRTAYRFCLPTLKIDSSTGLDVRLRLVKKHLRALWSSRAKYGPKN
jgi:hypothetical protein